MGKASHGRRLFYAPCCTLLLAPGHNPRNISSEYSCRGDFVPQTSFRSVPEILLHRIAATPDSEAYQFPTDNGWKTVTWRQVGERVRDIASGLRALGLQDEQCVAIASSTRFEWIMADLGILCAAGATTTIYPSSTAEDSCYIVKDSDSAFVFAENEEQVTKLLSRKDDIRHVKKIILFDGKGGHEGLVITLSELEAHGRTYHSQQPEKFEQVARGVRKDSLATIIYTSGTTGRPKGVELPHDCWVYEAEAIESLGILSLEDVQYLWLPLAHSFGKVLEAAQLKIGFKTAVDGRVDKIVENLAAVRPSFVAAVPRIFEKVYNKVLGNAQQAGGLKLKIFKWALGVGKRDSQQRQKSLPGGSLAYTLAEKLVFKKVQALFGGRLRFFISGSAPLSKDLAEFFHACGILILEGYGLTESSAASFVNLPKKYQFGTVGPALPGTEVKIAPEDGEILIRGRGIMRGYHGLPDATAEALDKEGWLHTGDIGEFKDGMLRITDRKKDLIKTSGGKYVAPQAIEGKMKLTCPLVSQVLVHGNNRNFCSMLIALDPESLRNWAKENGLGDLSYESLTRHEKVRTALQGFVDELNSTLASYESIKKFAILPKDLSLDDGDLTPSLKLKRKAVENKYRELLESFYQSAKAVA